MTVSMTAYADTEQFEVIWTKGHNVEILRGSTGFESVGVKSPHTEDMIKAVDHFLKDYLVNKELVLSMPKVGGVYIVTTDNELERLKGKSDILYIGRSGNLRRRIKYLLKYFLPPKFAGNWGRHTARDALKIILEE